MSVPAHMLRASLDDALEAVALTDDRGRELVAPVLTKILELHKYGVPEDELRFFVDALRRCCAYNAHLHEVCQRIAGTLDELARAAQHTGTGSIKTLAAELRPHLAIIADPTGYGSDDYIDAVDALTDLIEATPFDRLAGGSMRRALAPGRHALLMGFVRGVAEPQLTQRVPKPVNPARDVAGGEVILEQPTPSEPGSLTTPLEVAA